MGYYKNTTYRHDNIEKLGILLVNLGSPDAPTRGALYRYLKQFLWDRRVIEMGRPLWWLILNGVILNIRPQRSAKSYQKIWDTIGEGSPLIAITAKQTQGLQSLLEQQCQGPVKVAFAMRYGRPSIESVLGEFAETNVQRLLVLPLYPQYAAATTASTFDAISQTLQTWRWIPELRFINHYHKNSMYISALANSVREHWQQHGQMDKLLISFHGIPKRYFSNGDPYFCECHATARLLAEALELEPEQWQLVFQSRFGREEWLKPYLDKTLQAFPQQGIKRVSVICPGFATDCLETLEEVAEENRDYFLNAGGHEYHYIPALNERTDHLFALSEIIKQHLQGWPQYDNWDSRAVAQQLEVSYQQAKKLGAVE